MSDSKNYDREDVAEMEEGELVRSFEEYVGGIVDQIWHKGDCYGLSKDDLRSYGFKGLLEAFRNFDADRDVAFATYAYRRVRGEILDQMQEFRRAPRGRSIRERDDVGPRRANRTSRAYREASDEVSLPGEAAANPRSATVCTYLMPPSDMERLELGTEGGQDVRVTDRGVLETLRDAMEQLSSFERTVVRLHDIEGCTMVEIAEEMDCSKGWASRIRDRALDEMREYLRNALDIEDEAAGLVARAA